MRRRGSLSRRQSNEGGNWHDRQGESGGAVSRKIESESVCQDALDRLVSAYDDLEALDHTEESSSTDDDDVAFVFTDDGRQGAAQATTRRSRCATHPPAKPMGMGGRLIGVTSSAAKGDKTFHRRVSSCPLVLLPAVDTNQEKQSDDAAAATKTPTKPTAIIANGAAVGVEPKKLPTLPRFSPAVDSNCWSESNITRFRVRGIKYLSDKKKIPSQPFLLGARGCDLVLFDKGEQQTAPFSFHDKSASLLHGTLRDVPTLVINFRFPWGLLVLYFEIPHPLVPFMGATTTAMPSMEGFSPSQRVFAKWVMGDQDHKNRRLKLIPHVAQGPWVVRSLVTGKPALIGTKVPVTYHHVPAATVVTNNTAPVVQQQPYLLTELDIGSGSNTAKRIVSVCRKYMNALTVDIGFVIQGDHPEELPEQMLGSICVHGVDPLQAPIYM